jgi:hypothetical protein
VGKIPIYGRNTVIFWRYRWGVKERRLVRYGFIDEGGREVTV